MKRVLFVAIFLTILYSFRIQDNKNGRDELPKGSIVLWGVKTKIPSGWVVCDGLNGTPNLKDKFVQGTTELSVNGSIDPSGAETFKPTGKTGRYLGPDAFDVDPHAHYPGNQAVRTVNNSFELNIDPVRVIPPNVRLIYIMKIR
jgi:hypothetical protein